MNNQMKVCVCLHVCSFPVTMAVEKRLAFSVVQFLRDQIHCAALNSDEQESLEGGSLPAISTLQTEHLLMFSLALPSTTPCRHQWRYSVWRRPLRSVPATAISLRRSLSKRFSSTPYWRCVCPSSAHHSNEPPVPIMKDCICSAWSRTTTWL